MHIELARTVESSTPYRDYSFSEWCEINSQARVMQIPTQPILERVEPDPVLEQGRRGFAMVQRAQSAAARLLRYSSDLVDFVGRWNRMDDASGMFIHTQLYWVGKNTLRIEVKPCELRFASIPARYFNMLNSIVCSALACFGVKVVSQGLMFSRQGVSRVGNTPEREFLQNSALMELVQDQDYLPPLERAMPAGHPMLVRLISKLRDDPGGDWSLQRAARMMDMSERTFQRRLSGEGIGYYGIVSAARLSKAVDMVLETRLPATRIARDCGFTDSAHMTRYFVQATGLPPGRFRAVAQRRMH